MDCEILRGESVPFIDLHVTVKLKLLPKFVVVAKAQIAKT